MIGPTHAVVHYRILKMCMHLGLVRGYGWSMVRRHHRLDVVGGLGGL
jgi:hypothetical protein